MRKEGIYNKLKKMNKREYSLIEFKLRGIQQRIRNVKLIKVRMEQIKAI
ncbi:MAG: hypothetical protein AB1571_03100 [Nanoarchaeota archaeon]